MLSDNDDGNESLHQFTINEHYAKAFQYKKEREELEKLKEKYGSDYDEDENSDESDSESDESEDEDGEDLTPNIDAAILRTLARIKCKDPAIYDSNKNIFGEEEGKSSSLLKRPRVMKNKSRPIKIHQAAIQSILIPSSRSPSPLPHAEEQRALRDETIAAFHGAVDLENDDDLLLLREETREDQELEDEEYREFLEREVGVDFQALVAENGGLENESADRAALIQGKDGGSSQKLKKKRKTEGAQTSSSSFIRKSKDEEDHEFLVNFMLNRGWIDRAAKHIPTYREVTFKTKSESTGDVDLRRATSASPEQCSLLLDPDLNEEEDEDFEEIIDRFETSYNFRFEEPDAAIIKTYPRQVASAVRREDNKRKDARVRKKQRTEAHIQQKKEEIKRLKNLKIKDIKAKLERIGKEGGKNPEDEALRALDLEGDWDPEAHDRQMTELYGDETFKENKKPRWDDDIDTRDLEMLGVSTMNKKKKGWGYTSPAVDINVMDADVMNFADDQEWNGTEDTRKRKLSEYMDEVYNLGFNDMVGDIPTRFKYVPVSAQTYNLTPAEILAATDQELNEYMGIKKYAPYRKDAKWDNKRSERLKEFKQKLGQRMGKYFDGENDQVIERLAKTKRAGKKERMKLKAAAKEEEEETGEIGAKDGVVKELVSEPQKRQLDSPGHSDYGSTERTWAAGGKSKRRRKRGKTRGVQV